MEYIKKILYTRTDTHVHIKYMYVSVYTKGPSNNQLTQNVHTFITLTNQQTYYLDFQEKGLGTIYKRVYAGTDRHTFCDEKQSNFTHIPTSKSTEYKYSLQLLRKILYG